MGGLNVKLAQRQPNAATLRMVEQQESCRLESYWDPFGKCWTVGFGHTGSNVKAGMHITESQAEAFLEQDLRTAEQAISRYVTVELNDNQWGALLDFTYNAGAGNLQKVVRLSGLNAGEYGNVPAHLLQYTHAANGEELEDLVKRREAEVQLWRTPVAPEAAA